MTARPQSLPRSPMPPRTFNHRWPRSRTIQSRPRRFHQNGPPPQHHNQTGHALRYAFQHLSATTPQQSTIPMPTTTIQTLTQYLDEIRTITEEHKLYAYRGQGNQEWPLRSAATRRLLHTYGDGLLANPSTLLSRYLEYHRDTLLQPARVRGFGTENAQQLSDLQLLAKLQHFRAATGLLDFTRNPLIALYFGCQNPTHDGRVFLIDITPSYVDSQVVTPHDDETIDRLYQSSSARGGPVVWQAPIVGEAGPRVIAQQSIFILEHPLAITDQLVDDILIKKDAKSSLLESLRGLGVDEDYLFGDLYGFAQSNHSKAPLRVDITETKSLGIDLLKQKNYEGAIQRFTEYLKYDPMAWDSYSLRGFALAELEQYAEALEDFDKAAAHADSLRETTEYAVLYNRGNAHAAAGRFDDALADYSAAISCDKNREHAYANRGNVHFAMLNFERAIEDYSRDPDSSSTLGNKGIALFADGRMDNALNVCQEAIRKMQDRLQARSVARAVMSTMRAVRDAVSGVSYNVVGEDGPFDDRIILTIQIPEDMPVPNVRVPLRFRTFPGYGNIGPYGVEDGESRGGGQLVQINFKQTPDDEDLIWP